MRDGNLILLRFLTIKEECNIKIVAKSHFVAILLLILEKYL